jgi:hypothetical protein
MKRVTRQEPWIAIRQPHIKSMTPIDAPRMSDAGQPANPASTFVRTAVS